MSPLGALRLVSHNFRGWNSGHIAVHDLLKSCDICLIQEHWLLPEQSNLLDIDRDFQLVLAKYIALTCPSFWWLYYLVYKIPYFSYGATY